MDLFCELIHLTSSSMAIPVNIMTNVPIIYGGKKHLIVKVAVYNPFYWKSLSNIISQLNQKYHLVEPDGQRYLFVNAVHRANYKGKDDPSLLHGHYWVYVFSDMMPEEDLGNYLNMNSFSWDDMI